MQTLAQNVSAHIRRQELLKAGDRVAIAVSGGADSVALLRLLLELRKELGIVLSVVHFNHKLRGADADEDEYFVAELARQHKLDIHCECGNVAAFAAEKHLSLEAAARELRYGYFCRLVRQHALDRVATAHTLDDQAETVLLRVVRGTGTRGMAGIYPSLRLAADSFDSAESSAPEREGNEDQLSDRSPQFSVSHSSVSHSEGRQPAIVRPLLGTRRKELEAYLSELGQGWREDKSNRDLRHARNRVRHGIMPRLERNLNPSVRESLAETAEIARAEEEYWQNEVARVLPLLIPGGKSATLSLSALAQLPLALQRRVIRAAAELVGLRLEFGQVEEIRELGSSEAKAGKAALPDGWAVLRKKAELHFERGVPVEKEDYEYKLSVPGRIEVLETGTVFEAVVVPEDEGSEYNRDHFLDPALLSGELRVRNWRAGDRFWPAHTKAPKKIKELLQEQHVELRERKVWPVVVCGDEIVWVRGFPTPASMRPGGRRKKALVIRESPLGRCTALKTKDMK